MLGNFRSGAFPGGEGNRSVYIPYTAQTERMSFLSSAIVHHDNSTLSLLSFSPVKLIKFMVVRVMDLFLFILGSLSLLITRPCLSNVNEGCCIWSSHILYLKDRQYNISVSVTGISCEHSFFIILYCLFFSS